MQAILDLFNWQVFNAFGAPVTFLEIVGFLSGAATVFALARQWTWNWPVAIINALAFLFLFWSYGLYADSILQIAFLVLSIYGWWKWTLGKGVNEVKLPVRKIQYGHRELYILLGAGGIVYGLTSWLLITATDSNVWEFDAFILAGSLVATYMQARKIFESWFVWIAVDVVSIPLYFYKGLTLTGILYIIFMTLCIMGLIEWRKDLKKQSNDMRITPIDNPLDFREDGSIQKGDPAWDAMMSVLGSEKGSLFTQNDDGTWHEEKL